MRFPDRYQVQGLVGKGGMGAVYRVLDRSLLRHSALKVLHREMAREERHLRRFVDEAQITGQLDHPNIVPIHELGRDETGAPYFTMKLVAGRTLDRAIADAGDRRLEPDRLGELLQVFVKVCEAVAFAHHRGVVHRDLKPQNIMVGDFGEVYLMDWGLAYLLPADRPSGERRVRLGEPGDETAAADASGTEPVLGTPRYMAPEQVDEEKAIDERTDVFALGAILYHLLTGHPPYTEESYFSLLVQVAACNIPPPEATCAEGHLIPPTLSRLAMKALSPRREDRHDSVAELRGDIERFLRGSWQVPIRRYTAGDTIVREGEVGDCAFLIVEGRCAAYDDGARHGGAERRMLREMGPGEVFGETAVFGDRPRTATVVALDDCRLMVVDRDLLESGLGLGSWMGIFVKALADRFCEVDDRLRQLERPGS